MTINTKPFTASLAPEGSYLTPPPPRSDVCDGECETPHPVLCSPCLGAGGLLAFIGAPSLPGGIRYVQHSHIWSRLCGPQWFAGSGGQDHMIIVVTASF